MFHRLDKEEAISEHWSMENFRRKDRFYTIAFALVDAFASLEVGAVIVINARIAESLGLAEELSGYVITAYLYPLFGVLLLALAISIVSFGTGRTNAMTGGVHLVVFVAYLLLIAAP